MSSPNLRMTRNEIASFVGNDPRAIKALEGLLSYVNTILHTQTQGTQISSDFVESSRAGEDIAIRDSRIVKSNKVMIWLSTQ